MQIGGQNMSTTQVGSGFGGLIYILVKDGARLGNITVSFGGIVRAPWFIKGVTTLEEWNSTIR